MSVARAGLEECQRLAGQGKGLGARFSLAICSGSALHSQGGFACPGGRSSGCKIMGVAVPQSPSAEKGCALHMACVGDLCALSRVGMELGKGLRRSG